VTEQLQVGEIAAGQGRVLYVLRGAFCRYVSTVGLELRNLVTFDLDGFALAMI
jgi:hypothetical protein